MRILAVNRFQASFCSAGGGYQDSVFFITDVPASMQKDSALTTEGKDWKVEEKISFSTSMQTEKKVDPECNTKNSIASNSVRTNAKKYTF